VAPDSIEARFPPNTPRHSFGLDELAPFSALWASRNRPTLPFSLDAVTVYEVPGQPYILGYQHAGCIVALLAVDRENFFKLLRPVIGWQA
jgi:hypothetical protein